MYEANLGCRGLKLGHLNEAGRGFAHATRSISIKDCNSCLTLVEIHVRILVSNFTALSIIFLTLTIQICKSISKIEVTFVIAANLISAWKAVMGRAAQMVLAVRRIMDEPAMRMLRVKSFNCAVLS